MVAVVHGTAFYADGILPANAVLERSIGVLSGLVSAAGAPDAPPGEADALAAQRLASEAFSAGDVGRYQDLMLAGLKANLSENYAAAEQAYRAALELQRRSIGDNDPATSLPIMRLALQFSDEGRTAEADQLFSRAAPLAARSPDPTTLPQFEHDAALGKLNENKPQQALPLLRDAEGALHRAAFAPICWLSPPPSRAWASTASSPMADRTVPCRCSQASRRR